MKNFFATSFMEEPSFSDCLEKEYCLNIALKCMFLFFSNRKNIFVITFPILYQFLNLNNSRMKVSLCLNLSFLKLLGACCAIR